MNGFPHDSAAERAQTRYYVLGILTLVYAFNFVDRHILVILQESIKADLGLSDTQLGLLSGTWFAVIYAVAGIPIARRADHGNRRNIIALSLAFWSAMTALSGLAQSYFQLITARVGLATGQAGCSPPAHSMISDYFPSRSGEQRCRSIPPAFSSASCWPTWRAAGSMNFSAGAPPSWWSACPA